MTAVNPSPVVETEFQDIRIVDLDLSRTTWSRVHDSLRVMFLRLDREPPDTDWPRLFFEERESRIVARRRGLWIEDDYISFDSLPEEVEKIHIPDINLSIAYANRRYRELSWQRRLKRLESLAEQRSERDELLALQQRVRGLFGTADTAAAQTPAPPVPEPAAAAATPASRLPEAPVTAAPATVPTTAAPATAAPPTGEAAAAEPLTDFQARREALKQRFRSAAATPDKEQK